MARTLAVSLVVLCVCVLLVDSHGWWSRKERRGRTCPSNDFENHICCEWKEKTWLIEWEKCKKCRGDPYETGETCQYQRWWRGWREGCVHKYATNITEVHCQLVCCEGWKPDEYGYCTIKDDGSDDTIACENGGTPNGGRCTCPTGFEGIRCEKPKCDPHCLNNGACTGRDGKAVCACPEGKFTGPRCETPICNPGCQNGGSCTTGAYEAWCLCPDGFEGVSCEKEVKDGECPPAVGFGTCAEECSCDSECPHAQKCCKNGCGARVCREPAKHTCSFNGQEYQVGSWIQNDTCSTCFCKDPNSPRQWECTSVRCPRLPCAKVIKISGVCCPICDNVPTTTTPEPVTERPSCLDEKTGNKYPIGHTKYYNNGCKQCTCGYLTSGTRPSWQCMVIDCLPVTGCKNIRQIPNQCCPVCDDPPTTPLPPMTTSPLPMTTRLTCVDTETGIRHPIGTTLHFIKRPCVPCTCYMNVARNNATWNCAIIDCPSLPFLPGCSNIRLHEDPCCPYLTCDDTTTTTTQAPYPTCGYNGQRYPVGYNRSEVCSFCTCMDQGNGMYDWTCRHKDCPRLSCENQETPHGKCCPVCSDKCGRLCKMWCQYGFKEDDNGCPICACRTTPPTSRTSTPAPMCYHNGQAYPHMAERPGDACNKCTCQYQYGGYLDWSCMSVTCQPTTCENPIPPPGQCCPVCPATTTSTTTTTIAPSTGPRFRKCPNEKVIIHTHKKRVVLVQETLKLVAHDAEGKTYTVTYSKTEILTAPCACNENIHIITAQSSTDRYGRFATCVFTVHVVDNHPPVYHSCPSTITAFEDEVVTWEKPEVVDNIGIKSERFISDFKNNTKFTEGDHVLMYVAADYEGNVGVCRFLVSVYKRGTSDPTVPNQLKREDELERRNKIIWPIVGVLVGLILLVAVVLLAFCRRYIKKRNAGHMTTPNSHAYDNNIYAVPSTPPPSYSSSPVQGMKLPPKYIEDDKKPPVYDEVLVQVFKKNGGVDNPIYDTSDDLHVEQINVKLQLREDADA